jgi:hypothetical protein
VRLLARDPGQKPGYVVLNGDGKVLLASHTMWPITPGYQYDLAVTEGQWWTKDSKSDPNRLFRLALDAGWSLRGIPAQRYMVLVPNAWRNTNLSKEQVQANIARDLAPEERQWFKDIPKGRHGDVLDAIGIGRGALRHIMSDKYDWPGKGYGN